MTSGIPQGRWFNTRLFYGLLAMIGVGLLILLYMSGRTTITGVKPAPAAGTIKREALPEDLKQPGDRSKVIQTAQVPPVTTGGGDLDAMRAQMAQDKQQAEQERQALQKRVDDMAKALEESKKAKTVGVSTQPKAATSPEGQARAAAARETVKAGKEAEKAARASPLAAIRHDKPEDEEKAAAMGLASMTIPANTKINCVTEGAINTESPGVLTVRSSLPIYRPGTGEELMPQGVAFMGTYQKAVFGDDRVHPIFDTAVLPDGTSFSVEPMLAHDASGAAGLTGDVDNKYLKSAWALIAGSGFKASTMAVAALGNGVPERAAGVLAQDSASKVESTLQRSMNTTPTITAEPGARCLLINKKPILLRATGAKG